jgi:hypothetical protein
VSRTLLYQLLSCFLCCPDYWDVFRDCAAAKLTTALVQPGVHVPKQADGATVQDSVAISLLGEILGRDITWQPTSKRVVAAALDWPLIRLLEHQLKLRNTLAQVETSYLTIAQLLSRLLSMSRNAARLDSV